VKVGLDGRNRLFVMLGGLGEAALEVVDPRGLAIDLPRVRIDPKCLRQLMRRE